MAVADETQYQVGSLCGLFKVILLQSQICFSTVRMQIVYATVPRSALCSNGPSWVFFFP